MDTHIVMPDGTKLEPVSAEITMEGNAANTVRLTFMIPSLDVRARLTETILVCPACGSNQMHPCDGPSPVPPDVPLNFPDRFLPPAPVPDDAVYGD